MPRQYAVKVHWWPRRQRERLPLVTVKYYRPDPWVPEVTRRCASCGEWFTTIGSPNGLPKIELHEGCPKATPSALEAARRIISSLKRVLS